MLSRSLLVRSSPLRLSATLTIRECSRSLATLRHAPPPRYAVPSCANLRRFSAAPAFRTENQHDTRTSHAPSGTCYIANVPYKVTAEQLKDAFSEFGKVTSVKLLTSDAGLSRGVGFVQFESVADAVSFVEANAADPIFVFDRQLYVEHAQKMRNASKPVEPCDTLMVLKFQGESEVEVRSMFGSHADNILEVRFSKSRLFFFVLSLLLSVLRTFFFSVDRREASQSLRKAFIQFRDVNMATEAMDAFRGQNESAEITYARQRQPPANSYTLTSRLSQQRGH
ncbi:hypothetical protein HD554DRAFT_2152640 [Boletus coccyginus]|nr:hypothetical protein HD554DRAFT_2152640 [Boletus coccyginus]